MNILAVDDESAALWTLEKAILHTEPDADIACFDYAKDALAYAQENAVDVAFLDIEMEDINGLALAKKLKDINGKTNIIFVTGFRQYSCDAFALHASGYVLKPINPVHVAEELENLRHPVRKQDTGVRVQCFGHFEIFVDGQPVKFGRPRSKEILAYLVDRKGAGISKKELAGVLWEEAPYTRSRQSHLHILLADMAGTLDAAGAGDVVIKKHNLYAVDVSKFSCDFYDYGRGDIEAVNSYRGEYMSNYSWAEFRTGQFTGLE